MSTKTTHCPKGHLRTKSKRGHMECVPCLRESTRISKEKSRRASGVRIRNLDLSSGTRTCSRCGEVKSLDNFSRRSDRKNGLQSWCRSCVSDVRSTEEFKARERERWKSPEYRNSARVKLLRSYNLTVEQFENMMIEQAGCCAICSVEMVLGGGKAVHPHIDHDHATGVVRGLLCLRCNMGLGSFLDDPGLLEIAINYLEKRN